MELGQAKKIFLITKKSEGVTAATEADASHIMAILYKIHDTKSKRLLYVSQGSLCPPS